MIISRVHMMGEEGWKDIGISNGMINTIVPHKAAGAEAILLPENNMAFPGLINSHDHLDFNLFPQLGNGFYKNYTAWGADIYANNSGEINEVLKIPQSLRIQWGLYKNLLNGVATVVNHGKKIKTGNEILTVFQDCYSLHSLAYEKNWKRKLNNPFLKNKPFVIHTGEGTDETAEKEIDELIKANLFKKKMIAVHGVAMNELQARAFSALVWCPASNYFLFDRTATVEKLKNNTAVIFGSDSTLSAGWNIWEHLRLARKQNGLTDKELLDAVTATAAGVWGMSTGAIAENKAADIVVAKKKEGLADMDNFFSLDPEDILLVICKGSIRLFDESLLNQLELPGFNRVALNGTVKYVQGDLPALAQRIKHYYPGAILPFS